MNIGLRLLLLGTVALGLGFNLAQAATHNVGNAAELATAMNATNGSGTDDIIVLTGNIGLEAALPDINKAAGELTIEGGGFTLSRNAEADIDFCVLTVGDGLVLIENLTVSGGNVSGWGGGIVNDGALTLTNCIVSGNTATENGGGIMNSSTGTLTMTGSTLYDNHATLWGGGGIANFGMLTMTHCTVSGNTAYMGGGIANLNDGALTLTNCIVSGNTAADWGGGIANFGTMTLTHCTVSGNSATNIGGIYSRDTLTMTDCTVSGNSAEYHSGGIYNTIGTLTMTHCTVSGNSANWGGGIYATHDGTATLHRSIIAGNTAVSGAEIFRDAGHINADSHNVLGDSSKTTAQAFEDFRPGDSDVNATSDGRTPTALASILVTTLADNGGPTLTHNLVAGSPAIDIVAGQGVSPLVDQRGVLRPQGSGFDAGAVEFVPEPAEDDHSALFQEYWHTASANTLTLRNWNLDPDGILGASPVHSLVSGALPRGLSFEGTALSGRFANLGNYLFTVVSRSGIHEVRNHFQIRVIPPALAPLIMGLWVNDAYLPTVIMEERGHGKAATTELINLEVSTGEPLSIVFDWDYLKDDSSFRIIRGALPAGLNMTETEVNGIPSATISGAPAETGEFIFVVSVLDWRGRGYQWIRLVVE